MDRREDWRDAENCHFFDATCASDNEWNIDPTQRANEATPDARASGQQGRIMVIGFHVIRV